MSTTVIEALLVTLGLDPSQYIRGVQQHRNAQNQLTDDTRRGNNDINRIENQTSDAQRKRAKETNDRNKAIVGGIKSIRNEAIGMFALFTAGRGIKDFIVDTINGAASLGLIARNLDTSTENLNAWQRANERAGGTAAGMTAQFKESADAIAKYKLGQGLTAAMISFGQYGGDVSQLKSGEDFIKARADLLAKIYVNDPTKAVSLAAQMGISEDTFNLIKQGTPAVLALVDAQRKNSVITEKNADDAMALKNQWLDFTQTLEAATVKVLVALIPAFTKLAGWLVELANKIGDNKDAIAQWVTEALQKVLPLLDQLAKWVSSGDWSKTTGEVKQFASSVNEIAAALRMALEAYNAWTDRGKDKLIPTTVDGLQKRINRTKFDTDGKPAALTETHPGSGKAEMSAADELKLIWMRTLAAIGNKSAAQYVFEKTGKDDYPNARKGGTIKGNSIPDKLMAMGWTQAQAAGITGSLNQESGLDPNIKNPKSSAYGLGQWLSPRQADFKKWSGHDMQGTGVDEQLRFMHYELTEGKEKAAGDKLRAAKTAAEAAIIHRREYERPGKDEANDAKRVSIAMALDAAMTERAAKSSATPAASSPMWVSSDVADWWKGVTADPADAATRAANAKAAAKMPARANEAAAPRPAPPAAPATRTTDVKVGAINIHTQATDSEGIARSISGAVQDYGFIAQAETGLS